MWWVYIVKLLIRRHRPEHEEIMITAYWILTAHVLSKMFDLRDLI